MQSEPIDVLRPKRRRHSLLRDLLEVGIIALVLYIAIWTALQTVRVDGESMVNTLQTNDLLLASKISYYFGDPQRGDIVVLIPPSDPSRDFIKRVIGLPGDVLEVDGAKNPTAVLIKPGGSGPWQMLQEPYLPQKWTSMNFCCLANGMLSPSVQAVTVPAGMYFVMGDNRNFSSDSRSFGFVPRKSILAKAFVRIMPLGHFGLAAGPTLVPAVTGALAPAVASSAGASFPPVSPAAVVAVPAAVVARRRRQHLPGGDDADVDDRCGTV